MTRRTEKWAAARAHEEPGTGLVLVADDDDDICALIQFKLEAVGYRVVVARDGEEALAAAHAERPDLIVLDWMMPRLDGLEVCEAVRGDPELARVPIVMLTAKAQEVAVQRAFAAGADDYVVKPFSPRELASRVGAALARSRR